MRLGSGLVEVDQPRARMNTELNTYAHEPTGDSALAPQDLAVCAWIAVM